VKPLFWIGSSHKDLRSFPEEVQDEVGFALYNAQQGGKHSDAKPLSGFGGAGVLEIVERHDGDAFRAVYTVRLEEGVYVLHCFQKKSRTGISTPKSDMELIRRRLREAEEKHKQWKNERE
jgi:phage-related protein